MCSSVHLAPVCFSADRIESAWIIEYLRERARNGIGDGVWLAVKATDDLVAAYPAHTLAGRFGKPREDYSLSQLHEAVCKALGTTGAGSLTEKSVRAAVGTEAGRIELKEEKWKGSKTKCARNQVYIRS